MPKQTAIAVEFVRIVIRNVHEYNRHDYVFFNSKRPAVGPLFSRQAGQLGRRKAGDFSPALVPP